MSGPAAVGGRRWDVVVVGGGPAGLVAAATLGRHGLDVLVVERRAEPPTLPRATGLSTRVSELFRSWGLEAELQAVAVDADLLLWECDSLDTVEHGRAHEVGYPSRLQAAAVSPCGPTVVPQDAVEQVLRAHVATLPTVRVALGTAVVDVAARTAGVVATIRTADGRVDQVASRYLVAADGTHGGVRERAGIGIHEHPEGYGGVQVVIRAGLWDRLDRHRYGLYSVTRPDAPGLFLPAGGDRWVYGQGLPPGHPGNAGTDPGALVRSIRAGAGAPDLAVEVERVGSFTSHAALAERFRAGRILLVGDAAHRVTPRGGTGLNSAVLGAFDLGWKLAWVLRGWAHERLLDTYEEERRPVVAHHLQRSLDPAGTPRPVAAELAIDLGGRLPHAWLPGPGPRRSTLDLVGPGLTLLTAAASYGPWAAHASRVAAPTQTQPLAPALAATAGIRGSGAVLLRPDAVPVASWDHLVAAGELERAVARLTGREADRRAAA